MKMMTMERAFECSNRKIIHLHKTKFKKILQRHANCTSSKDYFLLNTFSVKNSCKTQKNVIYNCCKFRYLKHHAQKLHTLINKQVLKKVDSQLYNSLLKSHCTSTALNCSKPESFPNLDTQKNNSISALNEDLNCCKKQLL